MFVSDRLEARGKMGINERFDVKVKKTSGCHFWLAGTNPEGYGRFWNGERLVYAHRWAFERAFGPITEGLVLDHACNTPACVNPAHLRAVTFRENIMRGECMGARNAHKTRCVRGHDLTDASNLYRDRGRRCRACVLERRKAERCTS